MSLPDRLVAIITGGQGDPSAGGDGTFRAAADALWRAAGNQRRAAELAGVDRRTFQRWYQRWGTGAEPRIRPGTASRVQQGLRRAALVNAGRNDVVLTVTDQGPGQGRAPRTIHAGNLRLAPGTMERVADAWVRTGDDMAAARVFLDGIGVSFYRTWLGNGLAMDRPQSTQRPGTSGTPGTSDDGDDGDDEDDEDELDTFDAWDEYHDREEGEANIPSDYGGTVA